jgi:hypothetical protein
VSARDLDLAGLGLLGDGHDQAQHAGVVARLDPLQVEVVAQHQLPAERAARPLGREHLPVAVAGDPLGPHGEHVALDVQVDAVAAHARQVELEHEAVTLAPGVHRHDCGTVGGAQQLVGQAVELPERVRRTKQHHNSSSGRVGDAISDNLQSVL